MLKDGCDIADVNNVKSQCEKIKTWEFHYLKNLQRLRLQPDRRLAFLQGFLKNPHIVGSVIPSSRFLERRLTEGAGIERANLVVELGPGTGGTTRAIMRALPKNSKLLAIEIDPRFASLLRSEADPRLIVYRGCAENLSKALTSNNLPQPDVIVSGIPFSTMPLALGKRIINAVWSCLAPGGRFIAYQFRDKVAILGRELLGDPHVEVEFLNVPPMRFYRWDKQGDSNNPVKRNGKNHHNGNGENRGNGGFILG